MATRITRTKLPTIAPGTLAHTKVRFFVTLSVGTPLRPYSIAYRRAWGLFAYGLFKKYPQSPLWGCTINRLWFIGLGLGCRV